MTSECDVIDSLREEVARLQGLLAAAKERADKEKRSKEAALGEAQEAWERAEEAERQRRYADAQTKTADDALTDARRQTASYRERATRATALETAIHEGCPSSRMRLVDDPVVGPRLEVYVRNEDLRGWHWDWLQTLSRENAEVWRSLLNNTSEVTER